jgi:cytoskeletal protein RodZ
MPDNKKEVKKPSLTQRRGITGSKSLSSKESEISQKLDKSPLNRSNASSDNDNDDISLAKVVVIIIVVILLAVASAFGIIQLQEGDTEDSNVVEENQDQDQDTQPTQEIEPTDVEEEPEPTEEPEEVEPTSVEEDSESPEEGPTPTPSQDNTDEETQTNDGEFSTSAQTLDTGSQDQNIRIRTYQYDNSNREYYEFLLPSESINGSVDLPSSTAEYNANGNLVFTVSNVDSNFIGICDYLNDRSTEVAYGNVVSISCTNLGEGSFEFLVDTINETPFLLEESTTEIDGEEVSAVSLKIQN